MTFRHAASVDSLWSGEMLGVLVGSTKVVLLHIGDVFVAYEDRCAHLGVEISRGRLDGATLVCSAHEWTYDACTGRGTNPASAALRAFPVKIEGEALLVDVGDD